MPINGGANKQITGNIGLYWVCFKFSRMGLNVMPTARNARGVDLIAYDQTGKRFVGLQVKALNKRNAVSLGKSTDTVMGDFWVIVNNVSGEPQAFIMSPEEVRSRAHKRVKEDRVSYWLQTKDYDSNAFKERWDRIGQKIKTET